MDMRILRYGSIGPAVELLQLALNRAGFGELVKDGIFGSATLTAVRHFQTSRGLTSDGIVGKMSHAALTPYYTGYTVYKSIKGDTLPKLAEQFSTSENAILTANPDLGCGAVRAGQSLIIPLGFPVVPTDISYCSALVSFCVQGLSARYPFISTGEIGKSATGKPLWRMSLGQGNNRVIYNASFHANEWICTPLMLKFTEELAAAASAGAEFYDRSASEILDYSRINIVPCVNPDGIDLVTGELSSGEYYSAALKIAEAYPVFRFPEDWKANIQGVDLNLQYPALWEEAKRIKFSQGIRTPAPAEFVGSAPLTAPESRAMYDYTLSVSPSLILAYHTQGEVIYPKFQDYEPENSRQIADFFSAMSGYAVDEVPYASGFAGYKDWFIESFNMPGFTIEAGKGKNPLPVSQFEKIYSDNLGILVYGALVT